MPTRLVGIALLVAPGVQIIKRLSAQLRGWKSLAVNFFLCTVAQLAVTPNTDDIKTPRFWANVLMDTLSACGVHAIGKQAGLFSGGFQLPVNLRNPLQWACPHVDVDMDGRPTVEGGCGAQPGQQCVYRTAEGAPFTVQGRFHAERIDLVTGGGPKMSEAVAEGAAEAADVAPFADIKIRPSEAIYMHRTGELLECVRERISQWYENQNAPLVMRPKADPTPMQQAIAEVRRQHPHFPDLRADLDKALRSIHLSRYAHFGGQTRLLTPASVGLGLLAREEKPMSESVHLGDVALSAGTPTPQAPVAVTGTQAQPAPAPVATLQPAAIPAKPHLTLFQKTKIFFKEVFTDLPKDELVAVQVLTYITPLAGTVLTFAAPEDLPIMTTVVAEVQAGLGVVASVIKQTGSVVSLAGVVAAIKANLASIDAVVGIKSDKAKGITATIASELDGILQEFTLGAAA